MSSGLLANGNKHFILEERIWPEKGEVETTLSDTTVSASWGNKIWMPKILHNGERLDAKSEFAAILDFWSSFIHGETRENTLEIIERLDKALS